MLGSNQIFFFFGVPLLPEALCLLCEGSWVPSIGWLIQLGQQGLAGLLARVVRKLDCNGFSGTRRLLTVKTLDGLLGLNSPIKTNEADSSGNAWGEFINISNMLRFQQPWKQSVMIWSMNFQWLIGTLQTLIWKKVFIEADVTITNLRFYDYVIKPWISDPENYETSLQCCITDLQSGWLKI